MVKHPAPLSIQVAPASRRAAALELLGLAPTMIRRLLTARRRDKPDLDGLFSACRGTHLVGAGWGQVLPGNTAFRWPIGLRADEPEETARRLQQAVDAYLDRARIGLIQAIVDSRSVIEGIRLTHAGYQHLADLDYLVCDADRFPRHPPTTRLRFQAFRPGNEQQLAELVERTYHGTLDCSRLDPARPVTEVLQSYRRTGVYRPQWWFLAQLDGDDIGCLLLADHPAHAQVELMYIGIVSEHRGRGWGLHATRHAQWVTGHAGRQRLILAVDDSNWPARNVYLQAGFQKCDRQSVYVRPARSPTP